MAEYKRPDENWSEFQWENEIRRDERRISCYFQELPGCLDLPGEEDMIFDSLASRPDLVPTGSTPEALRGWQHQSDDDEDYDDGPDDSRRPGSDIVDRIDRLAAEWNVTAATRLRSNLDLPGLGVGCAYAKLLARTADFVGTEDSECGLKLSLGKRALADLNDLVGMLERIGREQHSLRPWLQVQNELFGHVRERLVDQLERVRLRHGA